MAAPDRQAAIFGKRNSLPETKTGARKGGNLPETKTGAREGGSLPEKKRAPVRAAASRKKTGARKGARPDSEGRPRFSPRP